MNDSIILGRCCILPSVRLAVVAVVSAALRPLSIYVALCAVICELHDLSTMSVQNTRHSYIPLKHARELGHIHSFIAALMGVVIQLSTDPEWCIHQQC